jgi:transcription elongation GreA/GreB family factor
MDSVVLRSYTAEDRYDHDAVNNQVNRLIDLTEQLARGGHASHAQNDGSVIFAGSEVVTLSMHR